MARMNGQQQHHHQINGFHNRGGGGGNGGNGGIGGNGCGSLFSITRIHRFFYWIVIFFVIYSFIILMIVHHKVDQQQTQYTQSSGNSNSNIMFSYNRNDNNNKNNRIENEHSSEQEQKQEKDEQNELPIFAICLLTRDDIPILSEWIAYHYHAVQLRHLVVAVDPDSSKQGNPKPLFDKFRKYLGKNSTTNVNSNNEKSKNTKNNDNNSNNNGNDNNNDYLIIDQWSDTDFMPTYFLNGDYGSAPNFVGNIENPDNQTWHDWYIHKKRFGYHKIKDQTLVNNHRYRQTRFLSKCSQYLKQKYSKSGRNIWMSTLDTDEYLVVNPWMINMMPNNKTKTKTKSKKSNEIENGNENENEKAAINLESGSVLRYLVNHNNNNKNKNNVNASVCIPIPRLLFGSVELNATTTPATTLKRDVTRGLIRRSSHKEEEDGSSGSGSGSNSGNNVQLAYNLPRSKSTMETLRWKYHASPYDERNFQQKVILDLNKIPPDDEIWNDHVHTVHRPSRILCLPESPTNFNGTLLVGNGNDDGDNTNNDGDGIIQSPVVAYHYIGSEERYFSRPNDLRRNPKRYRERSNITYQRSNEYNWIDQWLERFINGDNGDGNNNGGGVGIQVASILLQDHIIDADDIDTDIDIDEVI